jgi:hypothetical protein
MRGVKKMFSTVNPTINVGSSMLFRWPKAIALERASNSEEFSRGESLGLIIA